MVGHLCEYPLLTFILAPTAPTSPRLRSSVKQDGEVPEWNLEKRFFWLSSFSSTVLLEQLSHVHSHLTFVPLRTRCIISYWWDKDTRWHYGVPLVLSDIHTNFEIPIVSHWFYQISIQNLKFPILSNKDEDYSRESWKRPWLFGCWWSNQWVFLSIQSICHCGSFSIRQCRLLCKPVAQAAKWRTQSPSGAKKIMAWRIREGIKKATAIQARISVTTQSDTKRTTILKHWQAD